MTTGADGRQQRSRKARGAIGTEHSASQEADGNDIRMGVMGQGGDPQDDCEMGVTDQADPGDCSHNGESTSVRGFESPREDALLLGPSEPEDDWSKEDDLLIPAAMHIPNALPGSIRAWNAARPYMILWFVLSIVVLGGLIYPSWVTGVGPLLGIVGASVYFWPCQKYTMASNVKTIMLIGISGFTLDFFLGLRVLLMGFAFKTQKVSDHSDYMLWLIPGFAVMFHALYCMLIFRKMTDVSLQLEPISIGLVSIE